MSAGRDLARAELPAARYPCQHERYLRLGDGWINNTTYCGGAASTCSTPQIVTIPHATMPSPGEGGGRALLDLAALARPDPAGVR